MIAICIIRLRGLAPTAKCCRRCAASRVLFSSIAPVSNHVFRGRPMDNCIRTIALRFVVALAISAVGARSEIFAAESSKLNVVFILADDLGWGELGCFGQQ